MQGRAGESESDSELELPGRVRLLTQSGSAVITGPSQLADTAGLGSRLVGEPAEAWPIPVVTRMISVLLKPARHSKAVPFSVSQDVVHTQKKKVL
jgi:hypothetical protein